MSKILPSLILSYYLSTAVAVVLGPILVAWGAAISSWPALAGGGILCAYALPLGLRFADMLISGAQTNSLAGRMESLLATASALKDQEKTGAN